ncbi:pilus assembly protein CpaE [Oceanicola sp. 22II-s10i]|uniref:AAA family ATPase n=1 Tax=Oceanicola sp. 22II-s10i TaxID=1317116 RepID=UPI000B5237EA|nr:AAA family ATPase [Oceanicola sp. 22II-s10i]OWU86420.1 pilus assembly protein CpaE [Oceanicola sp. 22II-s10i]
MTSTANSQQPEPSALVACTIRREPDGFDLLIEDMEEALGEHWGDLGFSEALMFFNQPEAASLEFVAIAMDSEDEKNLAMLGEVITQARARAIKVILIAEDVSPSALHQLLRQGADEFVPYPLPEGELAAAISRIQAPEPEPEQLDDTPKRKKSKGDRNGAVLVTHGLAGGVGATSLAVNLAWELCNVAKKGEDNPKVCILDMDLQFGTVATYLDLPRREAVYELLSDTEVMDDEAFLGALLTYEDKLHALTAPGEMLPLDFINSDDVNRIISMARSHFDFVIVDMPKTLVQWSEAILNSAQIYFAVMELDMRSAQNCQRLKRALQAEELPVEKLRFVLNRAPTGFDLNGKQRVKRLGESLGISIELQLPDGGKAVVQAGDHGAPLARNAAKNPLRKEFAKLAKQIHEIGADQEAAVAD